MFFPLELKINTTYWFTNSHNSVFKFSLASLNKPITKEEEKTMNDLTLYLISGSKVLPVCTLGKNSLQVKLNLYLTLNKEYKNQNIGFFVLTSDGKKSKKGILLYGNYEYEETDDKYTPIKTSNKLPKYNLTTMSVERRIFFQEQDNNNTNTNSNTLSNDLLLKEEGNENNKFKKNSKIKCKEVADENDNSSENIYDDKNDKVENLSTLLNNKRKNNNLEENKTKTNKKVKEESDVKDSQGVLLKPVKIKKTLK
jgi:hypothetical protein